MLKTEKLHNDFLLQTVYSNCVSKEGHEKMNIFFVIMQHWLLYICIIIASNINS